MILNTFRIEQRSSLASRLVSQQKTQPHRLGFPRSSTFSLGYFDYAVGLRTFLALHDLEFNLIAFLKALVTLRFDCAVVNENIRPTILADESKPFGIVE